MRLRSGHSRPSDRARPLGALLAAAALACTLPSAAQTVRCEGADGKVTYANIACPDGSKAVKTLPPADPPTAADAKAARERARSDQQQVKTIESKREDEAEKQARERAAQARAQDKSREKKEASCRKLATQVADAAEALDRAPLAKRDAADARLRKLRAQQTAQCKG